MESRRKPQVLLLLVLFSVFSSQASAWPLFRAPSALRISYEGANEPNQASLKVDTDIFQNALAENDTPYYYAHSNYISEGQGPIKRHSDAVFTDKYSRLRKKIALRKYLYKILHGKRSTEGESPNFEELEK